MKTVMSSLLVLLTFLLEGGFSYSFPPTKDAPPVPSQPRTVDNSHNYFLRQDVAERPIPNVRDDFPDDPQWFQPESDLQVPRTVSNSGDEFERFYANGLPAIGPVATPIPDEKYAAEPSSILTSNSPSAITGDSDVWILRQAPDNQYIPERWVQVQTPAERLIRIINPDPQSIDNIEVRKTEVDPPVNVYVKTEATPATAGGIIQQVLLRSADTSGTTKAFPASETVAKETPFVRQIIEVPDTNVKQIVQQQFTKDVPVPPVPQVSEKQFSFPPPPPPPVKGIDSSPKVVSIASPSVVPAANVVIAGKGESVQRIRHVWVPTSARSGKFISFPMADVGSSQIINKGAPANVVPVSVSETWVLRDGPVPTFESQQKSVVPEVGLKNVKTIEQPSVIQVVPPPNQPTILQIKSPPVVQKTVSAPPVFAQIFQNFPGKIPAQPVVLQSPKTILSGSVISSSPPLSEKSILPSPEVPQGIIQAPVVSKIPCPTVPKNPLFPPSNPVIVTQKAPITASLKTPPVARIVRVTRFPYGSYYILNSKARPSLYRFPAPSLSKSKNGALRLVRIRQMPIPVLSDKVTVPVQTKSQPVQLLSPLSGKQFGYAGQKNQFLVSSTPTKSASAFPNLQTYLYPFGNFFGRYPVLSENNPSEVRISPLKESSEPSSDSESQEVKKTKKEEVKEVKKPKKEESKEEKPESVEKESIESEEKAAEAEVEKGSEENKAESEHVASLESAESQTALQKQKRSISSGNDVESEQAVFNPFAFGYDQRDSSGAVQHRKEISDADGRVVGSYGYRDSKGIYRNVTYVADIDGYRVKVISNEPGLVSHDSANAAFIAEEYRNDKEQINVAEVENTALDS